MAGIQSAGVVTGPYDVIAVIDAEDMRAVGSLIEQKIHTLSGVIRTVTCIAVGPVTSPGTTLIGMLSSSLPAMHVGGYQGALLRDNG